MSSHDLTSALNAESCIVSSPTDFKIHKHFFGPDQKLAKHLLCQLQGQPASYPSLYLQGAAPKAAFRCAFSSFSLEYFWKKPYVSCAIPHSAKVFPSFASFSNNGAGFQYISPSRSRNSQILSYTFFKPTLSA